MKQGGSDRDGQRRKKIDLAVTIHRIRHLPGRAAPSQAETLMSPLGSRGSAAEGDVPLTDGCLSLQLTTGLVVSPYCGGAIPPHLRNTDQVFVSVTLERPVVSGQRGRRKVMCRSKAEGGRRCPSRAGRGSSSRGAGSTGGSASPGPSDLMRRSRAAVLQAAQKQLGDYLDAVVNAAPVDSAAALVSAADVDVADQVADAITAKLEAHRLPARPLAKSPAVRGSRRRRPRR